MSKRLWSYVVVLTMLVTLFGASVPVYAKQDFCITDDFEDYVGTWDGFLNWLGYETK